MGINESIRDVGRVAKLQNPQVARHPTVVVMGEQVIDIFIPHRFTALVKGVSKVLKWREEIANKIVS